MGNTISFGKRTRKTFIAIGFVTALLFAFNNCSGYKATDLPDAADLSSSGSSAGPATDPTAESVAIQFDSASTTLGSIIRESFQIILTGGAKIKSITCRLNSGPESDCSSKTVTYDNLTGTDYTLFVKATTESGLAASQSKVYHKELSPPTITEPAWLKGRALNEWFQIPGTAGFGGAAACAYSGMALKESTSEIFIAAAGGHSDSSDNRVVSLRLDQDQPSWVLRMAPSDKVEPDVAYYSDGKPSSRHTYYSTHYIPQLDRVMLIGAQYTFGNAYTFLTVDGFNLGSNTWDKAGTWQNVLNYGKSANNATGDVWTAYGLSVFKWSASTGIQTLTASLRDDGKSFMAMQSAWDRKRNQLVSLGFGDGWGYNNYPNLNSYIIDATGTKITPLTFNPSPGYTQFLQERPISASFEYDADNDRFLYFGGNIDGGRIFIIKPNSTTVWDVSILVLGPGSKDPTITRDSGVQSRFRYVPNLKGFVYGLCPISGIPADLYFIRTAN